MRSKAAFRGHGLHPILVTVPLGALPTALVFQALHLFTGAGSWHEAAFVAVVIGTVGIVAASVPGVIDLMGIVPREGAVWRRATSHMALGFFLGAYYVALAALMGFVLRGPSPSVAWALAGLNLVGLGLLALQGFWGGELVERHGVGVHRSALEEERGHARGPAGRRGGA